MVGVVFERCHSYRRHRPVRPGAKIGVTIPLPEVSLASPMSLADASAVPCVADQLTDVTI